MVHLQISTFDTITKDIKHINENIEEQLADAEAKGIRLIDKTPRKGAEGMTIAFLHPKSTQGILTELCENKNK